MALEMRDTCERCSNNLSPTGVAFICSYECTYCQACSESMEYTCPNCGGELVKRPNRKSRE